MPKPYSALAFFALLIGFLLLLSQVGVLIALGILLVFWGLLEPFIEDWLQLIFHQSKTGAPGQNHDAPQVPQSDTGQATPGQNHDALKDSTEQTLPRQNQELSETERQAARIFELKRFAELIALVNRSEFLEPEVSQALLKLATAREERARAEVLQALLILATQSKQSEREEVFKAFAHIWSEPAEPKEQTIEEFSKALKVRIRLEPAEPEQQKVEEEATKKGD